jgi:hypothetical protein
MTNPTRIALFTAIAAAALWGLKAFFIGLAGGLGQSPLEGPFFFAGLAAFAAATVAIGVALTRGRPTWVRVLAGVVAPVLGFLPAMALDPLVGVFAAAGEDRHWVWSEITLWVAAAAAVALAVTARRRELAHHPGHPRQA